MSEVSDISQIRFTETHGGKVIEIQLTGKIARDAYDRFAPVVERLVKEHGKIRMLVDLQEFHGWSPSAFWQELKFDAKYWRAVERVAIVGERKWHQAVAVLCKPFSDARYFDHTAIAQAREWIRESAPTNLAQAA